MFISPCPASALCNESYSSKLSRQAKCRAFSVFTCCLHGASLLKYRSVSLRFVVKLAGYSHWASAVEETVSRRCSILDRTRFSQPQTVDPVRAFTPWRQPEKGATPVARVAGETGRAPRQPSSPATGRSSHIHRETFPLSTAGLSVPVTPPPPPVSLCRPVFRARAILSVSPHKVIRN